MTAAAVIPALIAYIKVAAVKKLVVGLWDRSDRSAPTVRGTELAGVLSCWVTAPIPARGVKAAGTTGWGVNRGSAWLL